MTGPKGILDKKDMRWKLNQMDRMKLSCEGVDRSRCLFPLGAYSKNRICRTGYIYSYMDGTCYI